MSSEDDSSETADDMLLWALPPICEEDTFEDEDEELSDKDLSEDDKMEELLEISLSE